MHRQRVSLQGLPQADKTVYKTCTNVFKSWGCVVVLLQARNFGLEGETPAAMMIISSLQLHIMKVLNETHGTVSLSKTQVKM